MDCRNRIIPPHHADVVATAETAQEEGATNGLNRSISARKGEPLQKTLNKSKTDSKSLCDRICSLWLIREVVGFFRKLFCVCARERIDPSGEKASGIDRENREVTASVAAHQHTSDGNGDVHVPGKTRTKARVSGENRSRKSSVSAATGDHVVDRKNPARPSRSGTRTSSGARHGGNSKVRHPAVSKKVAPRVKTTHRPDAMPARFPEKQTPTDQTRTGRQKTGSDSASTSEKQPAHKNKAPLSLLSSQKTRACPGNHVPPAPPPPPMTTDNQPRTGNTKVRSHGNKQEQPGTAPTAQNMLTRQTSGIDTTRLLEDIRNAAPKLRKVRRTDSGSGVARASDVQNVPNDQTAEKLFDPLARIWEQMEHHTVYDDSGEPVARYPLTTQGKKKYVTDLFSEFLFQQIEQQVVLSLRRGDRTLLEQLFKIAETVWISNHAGGSGRKVETPPWRNYIRENPGKLSYGLVGSYLNGNNLLIKSTFTTAIQKMTEQEILTIKELAGDDPEQMIQEAGQRYGLSREVNTDGQKKQFLDMFSELFAYARSHGIIAAHLQPKDCNLKLLVALITEDIDEMEKIRVVLIARATRVYNVTETQMKTMHETLVRMGHQGSYEDYVNGRFDL